MPSPAVVDRLVLAAIAVLAMAAACDRPAPSPAPGSGEPDPVEDIVDRITGPGDGGSVHFVLLVQRADQYAFDPVEVTIPSGDVVRFVMAGGQPESIAFDPDAATPAAAADFIRGASLNLGTLLTESGQAYDVTFRDAPPGRYPFRSLPHGAEGMRGTIIVAGEDEG